MNFIILETNRLILQGISNEDMNFIFENQSKNEIKKILGHRSEEDYLKEEFKYKNGYSSYNRSFMLFLLREIQSNCIIGRCGIHNWNKEHRRAEIGYIMEDAHFKRKGFMTEAVKPIIDYGFNEMNLNRLEAVVGTDNIPSLKILEKCKFIKEGVIRQHFLRDNTFEDCFMMSKLYREYLEEKKGQ